MANQETTKHLKFLWNASHTLLTDVPNLSAYYMQKFNQNSIEKNINLANNVKNKYCSYCGSIFLPGLNCRVRIEQSTKKKRRKASKRSTYNNDNINEKDNMDIDNDNVDGNHGNDNDNDTKNNDKNINNNDGKNDKATKVSKVTTISKFPRKSKKNHQIIYMKSDNDNDKNNSKSTMINFLFKDQVSSPSSSSSNKNQHRKNHISYYCNICKRESRFIGVKKKDIKNIGNIGNNITSNNYNINRSSSSSKSKKKKQKIQLQKLLEQEKRNNDDISMNQFSLTDFLSSIN